MSEEKDAYGQDLPRRQDTIGDPDATETPEVLSRALVVLANNDS